MDKIDWEQEAIVSVPGYWTLVLLVTDHIIVPPEIISGSYRLGYLKNHNEGTISIRRSLDLV